MKCKNMTEEEESHSDKEEEDEYDDTASYPKFKNDILMQLKEQVESRYHAGKNTSSPPRPPRQESPPNKKEPIPFIVKAKEFLLKAQESAKKPVEKMTLNDLAEYLSYFILYQDEATDNVAKKFKLALTTNLSEKDENKPFCMLLTGPSGVGKTETAKRLRTLCKMDIGDVHADAFVEYRFGDMSDDSQMNVLTGAAPGYTGFRETLSLCQLLEKATAHYETTSSQSLQQSSREKKIIIVLFDELDKASKKIMNPLNSFLSDGCVQNRATGITYTIPKDIRLIVCFTANFGLDRMLSSGANINEHYELGKMWVEEELCAKGYPQCDISRLGSIIPFFPTTKENLMVILVKRFYENIKKDSFVEKYGEVEISDETLAKFISSLLDRYNLNRGIRDACKFLDDEMTSFSLKNLEHFDSLLHPESQGILNPPARMQFQTIPYTHNLSKEDLMDKDMSIKLALNDRFNRRIITKLLQHKHPIEYFSLEHPRVKVPSINVLGVPLIGQVSVVNQFYFNDPSLTKRYEEVVSERQELKNEVKLMKNSISRRDQSLQLIQNVIKGDKKIEMKIGTRINDIIENATNSFNSSSVDDDDEVEEDGQYLKLLPSPPPPHPPHPPPRRSSRKRAKYSSSSSSSSLSDNESESEDETIIGQKTRKGNNVKTIESSSEDYVEDSDSDNQGRDESNLKKKPKKRKEMDDSSTPEHTIKKKVKHNHSNDARKEMTCSICKNTKPPEKFEKKMNSSYSWDLGNKKRESPLCYSCYNNK